MRTKHLLSASALVLGMPGLFLLFAPDLALSALGGSPDPTGQLFVQVAGGMCIALGVNNWMARGSVIGGIYVRPLLMGNLCAFATAGLSLLNAPKPLSGHPVLLVIAAVLLLCFVAFGRLMFIHPGDKH
jgi:hypothetical protein